MQRRTIVVCCLIVVFLASGLLFSKVLAPRFEKQGLQKGSDASKLKGTITVAGDDYLGYAFITSSEFQQRLRQQGYGLKWVNDHGDYADRLDKFAKGKYDFIVLPVNSYLFHGKNHRYPGVITAAISDSRGADNIVAYRDKLVGSAGRLPTINDLNNSKLKICLTPDSPSSFLLNTAIVHFALDELRNTKGWAVETNGSKQAYDKFKKHECDVAVLWEPNVSNALDLPGVVSVYGSDQISGMIIDVFVARRALVLDEPERVSVFFRAYFETLVHYNADREAMLKEMAKTSGFPSRDALEKAVKRVAWFDLSVNCQDWFGIDLTSVQTTKREKLIETIRQVSQIMIDVKELPDDPLGGNPYRITNSDVLKRLCQEMAPENTTIGATVPVNVVFKLLTTQEWSRLRVIGRMRILPITFDSGTAKLTLDGQAALDQVATALLYNFPTYRILVKGHSAPSGDETANVVLSRMRAEVVANYLKTIHGIDTNRMLGVGVGSREPLPRPDDEGELAYRNRLARVEFVLLEDGP